MTSSPKDPEPTSRPSEEPSPAYSLTCMLGYSLSFIIFGSQVSILGPTIGPLAERLGVDAPSLSPLFTALGISCIVSGAPSGWLVDRCPSHHVLIGSLLVQAIGFSLVPLMPSVWSLTTLWFIICFSYNFTNSAVFSSLTWIFPGNAGGALSTVLAMFGIGSFLIPLAAIQSHLLLGNTLAVFWIISAFSLLAIIPFFFVASPKCPIRDESSEEGESKNEPNLKNLEMVVIVSCVLLVFFSTTAETCVGNWINTYSQNVVGLSNTDAAVVNSTFWGCFTVGRIIGALISRFTSPAGLLLSFTPLSVLGTSIPIILKLWNVDMSWSTVMLMAVLSGLGNSQGYANAVALMERYVTVTGAINGVFGMVAGAACMVGPNLVAWLSSAYGTEVDGHFQYWFEAMSWVGLLFYSLHFPAIAITLLAGSKLQSSRCNDSNDSDIKEPLMTGHAHDVEAADVGAGSEDLDGELFEADSMVGHTLSPTPSGQCPSPSPSPSGQCHSPRGLSRRSSVGSQAQISFPGHVPISRSPSLKPSRSRVYGEDVPNASRSMTDHGAFSYGPH